MTQHPPLDVVLYEDRPSHHVGAKLAALSLLRHAPGSSIVLRAPAADPSLTSWAAGVAGLDVDDRPVAGARGWDVKPRLLLEALESKDTVLWVDTDVLTCADPRPLLADVPENVLVATEETPWGQHQGGDHRTRAWGLTPGRPPERTVNTGVVRVHLAHTELLEHWAVLLSDSRYAAAQRAPWHERPLHLLGDQEVLTALIGSADHARTPYHLLASGTDIAQCFGPAGLRPWDRVRGAVRPRRPLLFVHAMGRKPWEAARPTGASARHPRPWYDWAHLRTTPYRWLAGEYHGQLGEPAPWLTAGAPRALARQEALLTGFPLALVDDVIRAAKSRLGIDRYSIETPPGG